MATKVHMEALSPTMEEGQVVKWLKAEGDSITHGDLLAEIETDKATMELTARGDGILRKILVGEGGTAPVGDVIALIAAADEDISDMASGASGPAPGEPAGGPATDPQAPTDEPSQVPSESPAPDARPAQGSPPPAPVAEAPGSPLDLSAAGRVKASPVARKLAAEAGIDLHAVAGSGPGGRVVKRDVERARETGVDAAPATTWTVPTTGFETDGPEFEDVPLTQIRKTIARRLAESIGPVPHFFLTVDVDMSRLVEARARVNGVLAAQGAKVSINDFVLKATAAALRRHPECNAAWQEGFIRRYHAAHIGVAVAVEDGLITPVVRYADRKGLLQIGGEVREMASRAQEKKLKPEEYTGATFSVSNLGMFGIEEFTAVINPPEAGILAVGKVEDRAVVVDGQVVVQPRMRVTMSCDHRVIDGATGARFLQTLTSMLEEPSTILI